MADGSLFGRLDNRRRWADIFAGFGGASLGVSRVLGEPDVAVNHWDHAIHVHGLNHRSTLHWEADLFDLDPIRACRGRGLYALWASPSCTHHSRALGGVPRSAQKRADGDVVVTWARETRPSLLFVENVPEWRSWGPLDDAGQPIRERRGEYFAAWCQSLAELGYQLDHRVLRACDFGAPTTRERLYLVARRDGEAIRWPEPTHGPGRTRPWRTAAECIDWSLPIPSIFGRPRPLAEATQRRIAEGVRRFVLNNPRPFLLTLTHGGRLRPLDVPLSTVTTANRGEVALVAPFLANTRNGERDGQAPRVRGLDEPAPTVTAEGSQGALVAAFLAKHYGGVVGQRLDQGIGTVTAVDHHSLVATTLIEIGQRHGRGQAPVDQPLHTVTTTERAAVVAAFLARYYGQGGQWSDLREPMPTVTTLDRMAAVTVTIGGEPWAIVDIGMRMLQPRELARAQGFPDSYHLDGSKRDQVRGIGNSVCPDVAEALVRANCGGSR